MVHFFYKYCVYVYFLFFAHTIAVQSATLNELLEQIPVEMNWHSWQQRGILKYKNRYVFFVLGESYLIFSNGFVLKANIYHADGIIYFDDRSVQLIKHFFHTGDLLSGDSLKGYYYISTILIDPGHGGRDSGAIGRHKSFSVNEKDITLSVALELAKLLRENYSNKKILLTRSRDVFPTLQERVDMANNLFLAEGEAAIFISIHANAAISKKAQGFEVWHLPQAVRREVYKGEDVPSMRNLINELMNQDLIAGGKRLAEFIQIAMNKQIGPRLVDRGLREEAWFVVKGAHTVAVLVELGFVTNEEEARLLMNNDYQKNLAVALYLGISEYIRYFEKY